MTDALALTAEQKKAFAALKKAFAECEKTNLLLIGLCEDYHALNGNNVISVDDKTVNSDNSEIDLEETLSPTIRIRNPYIDVEVAVKVKRPSKTKGS